MPNALSGAMLITDNSLIEDYMLKLRSAWVLISNVITYFNVNITLRDRNISNPNKDKTAIKREISRHALSPLSCMCTVNMITNQYQLLNQYSNLRLIDNISCDVLKLHLF